MKGEKTTNDIQKKVKFLSWAGCELEYPEIEVNNFGNLISDTLIGVKINKEYINACSFEYKYKDLIHAISFSATSVKKLLSSVEVKFLQKDISAYSPDWMEYKIYIDDGHEIYHFSVYVSDDLIVRGVELNVSYYYLYVDPESHMGEDRWRKGLYIYDTALLFFIYLVGGKNAILRLDYPPVESNIEKLTIYYRDVICKLFGNFKDKLIDLNDANRIINKIAIGKKVSDWFEKACVEKYQSEDQFCTELYNDIFFSVDQDLALHLRIFDKKIEYNVVIRTEDNIIKVVNITAEERVHMLWVSGFEKRDVSAITLATIVSLVCGDPYVMCQDVNLGDYIELAVNSINNIYMYPWLRKKENIDKYFVNAIKNKKVSNDFINNCKNEITEIVKFGSLPPDDYCYLYAFRYSRYNNYFCVDVCIQNSREKLSIFAAIENEIIMDGEVFQENPRLLCTIYNYLYKFILDEKELTNYFCTTSLLQWDNLSWHGVMTKTVLSPDTLPHLFDSKYYRKELQLSNRMHSFINDCYNVSERTMNLESVFDYNLEPTLENNKISMKGEMYSSGCLKHIQEVLNLDEMSIDEVEVNTDLLYGKYSNNDVAIFKEFLRLYREADVIFDEFEKVVICFFGYVAERMTSTSVSVITDQIVNLLFSENKDKDEVLNISIQELKWRIEESSILISERWFLLNEKPNPPAMLGRIV